MHFYCVGGLTVDSEIALPGLAAQDKGEAEIKIRRGPVPETLESASSSGITWQIAGSKFLLRIPDIARFLLSDGREIAVAAEPAADEADLSAFIMGGALGILLQQRGQIVLQASAVRVGGKAAVFCGGSGVGKSTLAAALAQRGYPLLTDDVCVITADGGAPMVHSDGGRLSLWAQAIERLELADRRGARLRERIEKYDVEPPAVCDTALPLGAIYALREARPPLAVGIERPNVVDAALLLRRCAYRPLLIETMAQRPNYFRAAAAAANAAGIYNFTRHFRFAGLVDDMGMLEQHWQECGLTEKAA